MAATRTATQRAFDRAFAARLSLERRPQAEIAAMLSEETGRPTTQQTVSRDLAAAREGWRREAVAATDELVAEELARLNHLEKAYWEGYRRSMGEVTVRTTTTTWPADGAPHAAPGDGAAPRGAPGGRGAGGGDRRRAPRATTRQTVQTRQLLGNPAFLAGIERCHELRRKLLGLGAADRLLVGVGDLGPAGYDRIGPTAEETSEFRNTLLDLIRNPGGGETPPGSPRPPIRLDG